MGTAARPAQAPTGARARVETEGVALGGRLIDAIVTHDWDAHGIAYMNLVCSGFRPVAD